MGIQIGILDQSPVRSPKAQRQALLESSHLAIEAENLGFDRIWFAEHHFNRMYAGSNPEILMAHVLANTSKIKVGAGGIMLRNQTVYKIAEVFDFLSQLHPGRVELGLGESPGTPADMSKLFQTAAQEDLEEKMMQVKNRLDELAFRDGRKPIPLWTLCESGSKSVDRALRLRTGLAVAHYVSGSAAETTADSFVRSSQQSVLYAVRLRCAESRIERRRMRLADYATAFTGELGYFPGMDEISQLAIDDEYAERQDERSWEGDIGMLAEKISSISARLGVHEFLFLVNSYDYESRLKCYQIISQIKKELSPC